MSSSDSDDNFRTLRTKQRRRALKRARIEDALGREVEEDQNSDRGASNNSTSSRENDLFGGESGEDHGQLGQSPGSSSSENVHPTSSDSSDGELGDESNFLLDHLEEELSQGHESDGGGDGSDQDLYDPNNPDGRGHYASDMSDDSSDGEPSPSAASLQTKLNFAEPISVESALYLDIAKNLRHKETYESLIDNLINKNELFGYNYFPSTKKELWRVLGRSEAGIVKHVYCGKCGGYLMKLKDMQDEVNCPDCKAVVLKKKAKYFVTLSIKKQLQHILSTPGIADHLKYKDTRRRRDENAIEDIFDGSVYKELESKGLVGNGSPNLTYVFSTDGVKQSMNARIHIYPVFLRINELPPALRQKCMILAALYIDPVEPKMVTLLTPVVENLNKLQEKGVNWTPVRGGPTVESKLFPTCCCVDGKARSQVYNIMSHSGYFGCSYCYLKGVVINTTMRWPFLPHPDIPPYEDRTHDEMFEDMNKTYEENKKLAAGAELKTIRGHKGLSALTLLNNFDLRKGNAIDDLHNIFECAAPHVTNMLLTEAPRIPANLTAQRLTEIIDERLLKIKTPSSISRKPGSISIKNRSQCTGTEWRNWLIYFGLPCMSGLIAPTHLKVFEFLSRGTYLVSLDCITEEILEEADNCFQMFLKRNEELYGIERTKLNLHNLIHTCRSVKELGPLWAYSTFNFESWNHKIQQLITSPKGAILQVVWRHLLYISVSLRSYSEDVPDAIKQRLQNIFKKKRLVRAEKINEESVYVLGNSTSRPPTAEESAVLHRENIQDVNQMKVYEKLIVKGVRFKRGGDLGEKKSDDSMVYTHSNTFCTIRDIVLIERGETQLCGLFVTEHDVTPQPPFRVAQQVSSLLPPEYDMLHFIKTENIRSSVVKMPVMGNSYAAPLPNHFEID